jgi:phenylpyruvate tautomerase PptA (4-oxalocrotonate tautomerase family)
MPFYTCTTPEGTLTRETKSALAGEIAKIHAAVNHVPREYVKLNYVELPPENVFVGGQVAESLLLTGWARRGHPQESTTRLVQELAAAAARISGLKEEAIMVVILDSPASSALEGGRVLPEPGHEEEWLRAAES